MSEKLYKMLDKYEEMFGDGFPTIPLMWGRTENEVIAVINECLTSGKDVYQLGYVNEDDVY